MDYSHSEILTINDHIDKLITISNKKAIVEEKKAAKQKEGELINSRSNERML